MIDDDKEANKCEYIEEGCQPEAGYGYLQHDQTCASGRFFSVGAEPADDYRKFHVPPGYMGPFRTVE